MTAISEKLRYESYCVFPFVIINSTDPEFKYAEDLIKKNPKQIYQILSEMYDLDYHLIYSEILDDFLKPNMSERRDIAYLDSYGSALLIFGSETKNILKSQLEYSKEIKSVELKYRQIILEAFILVEILQITKLYLNFLIQFLIEKPSRN